MDSASNTKRPGESEGVREKRARLDKRNERDRARRRLETNDEKEARLAKNRDRQSEKSSFCYSRDQSRESYKTEAQECSTTASGCADS